MTVESEFLWPHSLRFSHLHSRIQDTAPSAPRSEGDQVLCIPRFKTFLPGIHRIRPSHGYLLSEQERYSRAMYFTNFTPRLDKTTITSKPNSSLSSCAIHSHFYYSISTKHRESEPQELLRLRNRQIPDIPSLWLSSRQIWVKISVKDGCNICCFSFASRIVIPNAIYNCKGWLVYILFLFDGV